METSWIASMTPRSLWWVTIRSLPDHCAPQNEFLDRISSDFHTCVPTSLAFVSTLLGSLSILAWLFAQLPQIFKNYNLQSTAGLSIYFLVVWCLGDTTNLLGAILTKQAAWQVVVATYYVLVDVVLVSQYLWYTYYSKWTRRIGPAIDDNYNGEAGADGDVLDGVSVPSELSPIISTDTKDNVSRSTPVPFSSFRFPNPFGSPKEKSGADLPYTPRGLPSGSATPSPKTLVLVTLLCAVLSNASPLPLNEAIIRSDNRYVVEVSGRILSWTSTVLYLGSRLPQLYKNHTLRSTVGLSPSLFIAAFFGNLFYSTSLLTNPLAWASYPPYGAHGWAGSQGSVRAEWVSLAAPFWLGAAGVLTLDATVGVQFLMFGEGAKPKKEIKIRDQRDKGHWRKVSGYMRGWWPGGLGITDERRTLLRLEEDAEPRTYGGM